LIVPYHRPLVVVSRLPLATGLPNPPPGWALRDSGAPAEAVHLVSGWLGVEPAAALMD